MHMGVVFNIVPWAHVPTDEQPILTVVRMG